MHHQGPRDCSVAKILLAKHQSTAIHIKAAVTPSNPSNRTYFGVMISAWICSSCRRELQRRTIRLQKPQCLSRATFISLANVVPPTPDDPQHRPPQSRPIHKSSTSRSGAISSLTALSNAQSPKPRLEDLFTNKLAPVPTGRYSRGRELEADDEAAVRLRNLQNLRLTRQPETRDASPSKELVQEEQQVLSQQSFVQPPKVETLVSPKDAADPPTIAPHTQLRTLLEDPTKSNDEIWDFFVQRLDGTGTATWATYGTTGGHTQRGFNQLGSAFNLLLLRMTESWKVGSSKDQSPSQVAQALEKISVVRPIWYVGAIWELLLRAESAFKNEDKETVALMRDEILRLWALLFKNWLNPKLHSSHYTGGDIDWSGLPDPGLLSFKPMPGEYNKQLEFRVFGLLRQMPSLKKDHIAAATLFTSDLLCRELSALQQLQGFDSNYRPFFEFLTKIFSGSRIDNTLRFLQTDLAERCVDPTQLDAMLDRMKGAPLRASLAASSDSVEAFANGRLGMKVEHQQNLDEAIAKNIGRRLEKKDASQIIQIWDELRTECDATQIPLGNIVYDNLIYAFDKLSRPDLTINVWNHMINHGVKPNADQWRKLLQGRGRDPETMERVWRHMLAAGVKPDLQAWNSRIQSLLLWGDRAEQGLIALDDMTKTWLAAVNKMWPRTKDSLSARPALSKIGDFPDAPRPNQYTLNACISGLVKRRYGKQKRLDLIPQVFQWADSLEISPNVVTYNIMIGMCIKDGNIGEATQIMTQMRQQNIQPDAATFTLLMNHIFKPSTNAMPLSLEEQEESVAYLLTLIDSVEFGRDEVTYSTLIDGLLKGHRNILGANLVFEAMVKREVKIQPHVWTNFLTYYFQEAEEGRGSPDFAAIEALWNRIQAMDGLVDRIFYDRVIEGYARYGEVDLALHFLRRMAKEARKPGWPCLTAMVRALLRDGRNDQAAEIVHDIEHSDGYFPHGIGFDHSKFNPDRSMFWEVVVEAGLREMPPMTVQEKDRNDDI